VAGTTALAASGTQLTSSQASVDIDANDLLGEQSCFADGGGCAFKGGSAIAEMAACRARPSGVICVTGVTGIARAVS
jgi:hypothetical protein